MIFIFKTEGNEFFKAKENFLGTEFYFFEAFY